MIFYAEQILCGDKRGVMKNAAMRVAEGKVQEILSAEEAERKYPHEENERYPGQTILPGYVDMHVHLGNWSNQPYGYLGNEFMHAYVTLRTAKKAFEYGVTTLRDVCTTDGLTAALCAANSQRIVSDPIPRVVPCGNGICMTGGHGSEFPNGGDIADGPWEMRRLIRKKIAAGSKWIKLLTSRRTFTPEFTKEELDAAADECHRRGIKVAAHSGVPITIQMCIDAGIDTIEHGTFMSLEQARQMQDKGLAWDPTILPYYRSYSRRKEMMDAGHLTEAEREMFHFSERAVNAYFENFKAIYDTGVCISAGTDLAADVDGTPVAEELILMVKCGITPLQAIAIGPQNGAKIIDMDKVTGSLCEGLSADFQIIEGNPFATIEDLRKIRKVYLKGKEVFSC